MSQPLSEARILTQPISIVTPHGHSVNLKPVYVKQRDIEKMLARTDAPKQIKGSEKTLTKLG